MQFAQVHIIIIDLPFGVWPNIKLYTLIYLVPAKIVSFFLHRSRILKVTTQIQKVQLVKKSQNCDRTAHGLLGFNTSFLFASVS